MLHINHPKVISTARLLGISELQALRHERQREELAKYYRYNPNLITVFLK